MTIVKLSDSLPSEEQVLRRIVRAIQKAVEEDLLDYYHNNRMETMNSLRFIRSDMINENLKNIVVDDSIRLLSFKRFSWEGRMLVDDNNIITYTITTHQNLIAISKKKNRKQPHFLQSIFAIENGDLEGDNAQTTIFPMESFDRNTLEEDYRKIVSGLLSPDSGYRHYVITYEYDRFQVTDIRLILSDKSFNTVDEISLNNLMKPNFGNLTNIVSESDDETSTSKSAKGLVALKPGIKPELVKLLEEDQA